MLQTLLLAFSLSTDAFAAAVAKGARFPALSFQRCALIALSFGALEALAPLIGYVLGLQFAGAIEDYDHWIAFIILGLLGARMIHASFSRDDNEDVAVSAAPTLTAVVATALGTSVDATAVGVTLAFFSDNIPVTLAAIGAVTFAMTLIGLRLGCVIGERTGKWAELLGGLGLIAIGAKILVTHLMA
jgi:manganese efflux pump family protein